MHPLGTCDLQKLAGLSTNTLVPRYSLNRFGGSGSCKLRNVLRTKVLGVGLGRFVLWRSSALVYSVQLTLPRYHNPDGCGNWGDQPFSGVDLVHQSNSIEQGIMVGDEP
ncbi:hypothetical protein I7I51_05931 [Histoplasma capsulatum]|uniref:Uncharacterized protein n=1 Tax=Ajellomyces capsulatus TaxID=5037 RepID=A0A8A1MIY5_AJECA|nr:hypothetical protein I7I51_05931 [Histoplasma capsulatum]